MAERLKPTMGSLFSGIGGFDLGFERAGFEIAWQVEIDPYCRKVLAKNFPDAERFEDVRIVGRETLRSVDIICGGFPCQDISIAGNRDGITGTRSGLWIHFKRIISELRPRVVLLENVRALLSPIQREGWVESAGIATVLGDLAEIGYDAEWDNVSAAFIGAPQPRERVWILAYPSGQRNARLIESFDISRARQGWSGCQANLQRIADSALIGTDCFPQPLLRGMDDRPANWMDRVAACGNAVIPQITEMYARLIDQLLESETI